MPCFRDMRHDYLQAVRGFEAAMESVAIVAEHLEDWVRLEDIYTERPFWQNSKTGQVAMEKPGFEHYLPITFRVPSPPKGLPPDVPLSSSSEGEDKDDRPKPKESEQLKHTGVSESGGILIEDAIHVSDSEGEDQSEFADRSGGVHFKESDEASPLTSSNLKAGDRSRLGNEMTSSNYSMPTVTTAQTGAPGSFAFASSFKRYQGQSFVGIGENSSEFGSFYKSHVPQFNASMQSITELPHASRPAAGGEVAKLEDEDVQVLEMHRRIDAALRFQNSAEYKRMSALKGRTLEVGAIPDANVLSEIKAINRSAAYAEKATAERAVVKVNNCMFSNIALDMSLKSQSHFNPMRHETYTRQLNRPARSFEEIRQGRESQAKELEGEIIVPKAEELLNFAGGDNRMTWAKGNAGMRLRTVLAHRALHVEKQLKQDKIRRGEAKKETFFEKEIAPFFKEGLSSSSGDEDDEERMAKKQEEQRQLLRARRDEEDRRAMETLRRRRLKEKFTR